MSPASAGHGCQIVTELTGVVRVVRVTGRLDSPTATSFRDRIRNDWTEEMLIVDLSRLSGLDSPGTGAVLAAAVRARPAVSSW